MSQQFLSDTGSDPSPGSASKNLERSYKDLDQLLRQKKAALEKIQAENEDLQKLLNVQV